MKARPKARHPGAWHAVFQGWGQGGHPLKTWGLVTPPWTHWGYRVRVSLPPMLIVTHWIEGLWGEHAIRIHKPGGFGWNFWGMVMVSLPSLCVSPFSFFPLHLIPIMSDFLGTSPYLKRKVQPSNRILFEGRNLLQCFVLTFCFLNPRGSGGCSLLLPEPPLRLWDNERVRLLLTR